MNVKNDLFKIVPLIFFVLLASCALSDQPQQLPKVLLIGDSVSIGYTNYVKGILYEKMEIHRPLNSGGGYLNCEGTTRGVESINEWVGNEDWDVIHFNFGLHDLKHVLPGTVKNSTDPTHPQQADLTQYERNLREIVAVLKSTGAKLIFATTTPFSDNPGGPYRRANQPDKYNAVAKTIMKKEGIRINDLHDFVLPRREELMLQRNVHFKESGSLELALQVIASIEAALE